MSARSGQLQGAKLAPRDVRGTEREKTGTGTKLERTRFFPFPFLQILTSAHLYLGALRHAASLQVTI